MLSSKQICQFSLCLPPYIFAVFSAHPFIFPYLYRLLFLCAYDTCTLQMLYTIMHYLWLNFALD